MKKITLASLFGVLLVFTINVNASATSMSWDDIPSFNSFGSGVDTLYGFGIPSAADSETDKVDYLDTYAFSDDNVSSVDPEVLVVASDSIIFDDASNFEEANVMKTADPIPASAWLLGSTILGIGGLASRRKPLPN